MPPDKSDVAHFWDMLEVAREALSYVSPVPERHYLGDQMRRRALERTVEILGEAAGRVSESGRRSLDAIEWTAIVGQRVVLAHRYAKVDHALLYRNAREKLPVLIGHLESLLQEEGRS
ncbi:MAG: DUF86 domain-containing protein [Burkholderiales bacterium]|nr:DUF86 domain-containing protein [Burkholderiales bacterium]